MPPLTLKQEAFCRAYAALPSGAVAARSAGYAPASAAQQAVRLLHTAAVSERLVELRAEVAARREEQSHTLIAKLEPVYEASLKAGDHDGVLQVVELQARIAGLVQGGATLRPRLVPLIAQGEESPSHEAALLALEGDGEGLGNGP